MMIEIITFNLPEGMSRDDLIKNYHETVEKWRGVNDLIRKSYIFDEKFYFSNKFYGLLSEGKQNGYDYIRLLDDLSENYKQARIYAQYEIEN